MREVEKYRPLAELLHKRSSDFFNSSKWVKELTAGQRAVHKVSQEINVDCHNGYMSSLLQHMTGEETFRLQHRSYFNTMDDILGDSDNTIESEDVPLGIILRRLTDCPIGYDKFNPAGKLTAEVLGTLYAKTLKRAPMQSICKVSHPEFSYTHPWFWEVPSVDEILKVFTFSEQGKLNQLEELSKVDFNITPKVEPVPTPCTNVKKTETTMEVHAVPTYRWESIDL